MQFNLKSGLFFLILLAALGYTHSAEVAAADNDSTGQILYTTQAGNNDNTVNMLSDDGQHHQEIEVGQLVWGSSWSPDGTRILLNRQENGLGQIYRLNVTAEGKNPVKLTSGDAHYYNPVWSPSGDTIAYAEDDVTRAQPRLMLMAADGDDQRVLYRGAAFFNAWSPDGTQVIITVEGEPLILDIATNEALPLKIQGFEDRPVMVSDWSKDGRQIAFTHIGPDGQQIYIASIDGTNVRKAVEGAASSHTLKWASDGSQFVFISTRDFEGGEVYIADADGSNVKRLTFADSTNPVRISTLAYWTPMLDGVATANAAPSVEFDGVAVRDLVNSPVDTEDPISVTRKFMTLLVDGELKQHPRFVCPQYLDMYLEVAESTHAAFSDLDLSAAQMMVVGTQPEHSATQVQLTGTISVVSSGSRVQFPAGLFPVMTHPVTLINLVYDGGWAVCTPL